VSDADDANDIAQEVFIEVYKTIDKFRNEAKISTWLYRISVNRSLNFLRDNKKHRETESYSEEPIKIVGAFSEADETPESSYLNQERSEILNKAIDSLPERQKTVFILNKKEALSAEEIGKVLGLSLKAVESLIIRAKLNLQKMLLNYYKQ
jgi:RNA polymerase sigma-70 factor (ECF subfamily)